MKKYKKNILSNATKTQEKKRKEKKHTQDQRDKANLFHIQNFVAALQDVNICLFCMWITLKE